MDKSRGESLALTLDGHGLHLHHRGHFLHAHMVAPPLPTPGQRGSNEAVQRRGRVAVDRKQRLTTAQRRRRGRSPGRPARTRPARSADPLWCHRPEKQLRGRRKSLNLLVTGADMHVHVKLLSAPLGARAPTRHLWPGGRVVKTCFKRHESVKACASSLGARLPVCALVRSGCGQQLRSTHTFSWPQIFARCFGKRDDCCSTHSVSEQWRSGVWAGRWGRAALGPPPQAQA